MISALAALLTVGVASAKSNPIIGIFAQPTSSSYCPNGKSCQYIAASYIKFIESNGGRVVPINYYSTNETIDDLFNSLNGILFPGGSSLLPESAHRVYENAIAANNAGDYFPLWGTCMGFEWLVELGGGVLDGGLDAENVSLPLIMTDAAYSSRLLSGLDPSLFEMLQGANTSAFNNHGYGIYPTHFEETASLANSYNILSTSFDRNGVEFVSMMEHKVYPFYGVQWHPEKNVWELGETTGGYPYENIPHTQDAMATTLYLAKYFVSETRKNNHAFENETDENNHLIWQYPVYYTGPSFVQEYISDF